MFLTIIAFISLIGLVVLHEFGHFILAKRFGVKVEEFGIGYPPRLFGKKIGETIYSLNLLPFGAFVRLPGEIEKIEDSRSFSRQSVGKRALIAFGGVLSFWFIAAILFSIVFNLGTRVAIDDEENYNLIEPQVQIAAIMPNSPAEKAGIKVGDTIASLKLKITPQESLRLPRGQENEKPAPYQNEVSGAGLKITKVKEVQDFTNQYKGEEITLIIERGKEIFDVTLVPRILPPTGEGAMGIGLVRTAIKKYSWYEAPIEGVKAAKNMTLGVIGGYFQAISRIFRRLPSGVELMGPVGIFHLLAQASKMGLSYFLQFIGMISIYVAVFNALPIPAADGGKLLFLGIEAARKKPISEKIEQSITSFFFAFLILLMIMVTIKDIRRIL